MDSDVVGIICKLTTIMEKNMSNRIPTCLGSGVFNLDTVVVREYPGGYGIFALLSSRNQFFINHF